MKTSCCVLLSSLFCCCIAHAEKRIASYAFDKKYEVALNKMHFEQSPAWRATENNPPLAARDAIRRATDLQRRTLKDSDGFKWTLQSASLQPYKEDVWYWVISFEAIPQRAYFGMPNIVRLIVLMDGTVIEPKVTEGRR